MGFLGNNSAALGVILSAISVLGNIVLISITFYYARLARRSQELAEESQKRVEESQKLVEKLIDSPKVVVYLRNDEMYPTTFWVVCVENVGTGTARNVRFQPDRNIPLQIGDTGLEDIRFIKNGIDYFGKGQKYEFIIQTYRGEEAWNELTQTPLKITIRYENADGKELVEDSYLDFGAWDGVPVPTYPIGSIANTLKQDMVTVAKDMVKATKDIGKELNQYTDIRAGDKVRTTKELKAYVNGDLSHITTIPKDSLCTVLEVTREDITIEWDDAPERRGRIVYRGWRVHFNRSYRIEKIKLPPKQ